MDFNVNVDIKTTGKTQIDELEKQIQQLKSSTISVKLDVKNSDVLKQIKEFNKKIKIPVDTSGLSKGTQEINKLKSSMNQLQKFKVKIDTKGVDVDLSNIENKIKRFNTQAFTPDQKNQVNSITQSFRELQSLVSSFKGKDVLDDSDLQQYNTQLKTVQNQVKLLSNELSSMATIDDRMTFSNKIETWLKNNTKVTEQAKAQLQDYIDTLRNAGTSMTSGDFNSIRKGFTSVTSEMKAAGKTGKGAFDDFKRAFSQIFQFAGAYGVIQNVAFEVPRQMVQAVIQVDSAMTNLQMATGVSNDRAKELMSTYSELGNQLKATSIDVATSATEWLKQGKSIEESQKLAQDSIVLSKIGDLSSEDATKTITAAMKSYNLTESEVMSFIDQISAIDMASATDVGGLATAFNEVAANAKQAGVETQELLSYAAVIGETTQEGMASVGTSLNAIFARMGNIKLARLKDYENNGEDLSNVETVLRGVGINLRSSTNEFRDFDEVLAETASRWSSFSGVQQRAVAQAFAGTHHMNEFMILMQNFPKAQEYMQTALDSSGESMKKYEAYTDSIQGKLEGFKNSFISFSTSIGDSDVFKGVIDAGTELLNVLTKLTEIGGGVPAAFAAIGGIKIFKNLDQTKSCLYFTLSGSTITEKVA